jgi:hypothetical protein
MPGASIISVALAPPAGITEGRTSWEILKLKSHQPRLVLNANPHAVNTAKISDLPPGLHTAAEPTTLLVQHLTEPHMQLPIILMQLRSGQHVLRARAFTTHPSCKAMRTETICRRRIFARPERGRGCTSRMTDHNKGSRPFLLPRH